MIEELDPVLLLKASRGIESLFKALRTIWETDPVLGPQAVRFLAECESLTGPMILHVFIVECERQTETMLIRINSLFDREINVKEFAGSYL